MRKKADQDDTIQDVNPNEISSKEFRQNWARLIQKIYEVNPLICPKCQGAMRTIRFIEELDITEKSYAIFGFGMSLTMTHRELLFPIPKSRQTLKLIFQRLAGFPVGMFKSSPKGCFLSDSDPFFIFLFPGLPLAPETF